MSTWIWLMAFVPPLMYACSNVLDSSVVCGEGEDSNPWSVVALGGLFDLLFLVPIGAYCLITGNLPSTQIFGPLFLNGISVTIAGWLFYRSVKTEDASKVVTIFQTIPFWGIFFGFYGLDEALNWNYLTGIIFLVLGGFALSTKGKMSKGVLAMMLLSSLLYVVNDFVLAKYGREILSGGEAHGFLLSIKLVAPVIMADLAGKVFFGIIVLVGRKERHGFLLGLKSKLGIVGVSSVVYTAGDVFFDIAKIYAPIALVQAMCCTQPLFVLLWSILSVTLLVPYLRKKRERVFWDKGERNKLTENLIRFCLKTRERPEGMVWKVIGIILMVIGGILFAI